MVYLLLGVLGKRSGVKLSAGVGGFGTGGSSGVVFYGCYC